MTDEKLAKAVDLKDSIRALSNIRRAFTASYPDVYVRDSRDNFTVSISFYSLDDTTQKEFKKLILDYIDKRFEELEKEYKEL